MILANVAVARELGHTKTATLYRVHGKPDEEKLDKLLATLTVLGIEAQIPENVAPRDIQAITRRLKGSAELPFVESLVVRSMPQAVPAHEYRALRSGAGRICTFHLTDQALSRSGGPPHLEGAGVSAGWQRRRV